MKNKLKGFTLVEVMVALSVFAIMALMLGMIFAAVGKMNYSTHKMNDKLNEQAVYAEDSNKYNQDDEVSENSINFKISGSSISVPVTVVEVGKNSGEKDDTPNIKYFYVTP